MSVKPESLPVEAGIEFLSGIRDIVIFVFFVFFIISEDRVIFLVGSNGIEIVAPGIQHPPLGLFALVAAIDIDAEGPERIQVIFLPVSYTHLTLPTKA